MDALKASGAKALLHFCAALPLEVARSLGRGVAWLFWLVRARSRKVTERNISLAYPQLTEAQQRVLARSSLLATGELVAEMGRIWLRPWWELAPNVKVSGGELISEALDSGRGVLVLGPHLGNWEVVGLHLATLGPAVSLYQPPRLARLDGMIRRFRQQTGANLVATDRRGLATLLQALGNNEIVGVLPDQVPPELAAGENASFMGVSCFTPTLASHLLQRTGALAVLAFAERVPGGFRLRYRSAAEELYSADLQQSLEALNREMEECIKHCPEQYRWEYKRFRARPKAASGVYAE